MSRQESEDERIRRVLMESDSEDDLLSDGSEKENHVSTRSQDSDTDQNASSGFDNDDDVPLSDMPPHNPHVLEGEESDYQVTNSFYIGKDGTRWSKNPPRQQVRTCSENIVRQIPGVSPAARSVQSELLLMLSVILIHTNLQIREIPQLPRQLRKRIREFSGEPEQEAPVRVPGVRKRCQVCPYARHRKTANVCDECHKYICPEHTVPFCQNCVATTDNNDM